MLLRTVARPRLFDVVFTMKLAREQDEAVRAWRRQHPDMPTRTEAIRRLIDIGLKVEAATPKTRGQAINQLLDVALVKPKRKPRAESR